MNKFAAMLAASKEGFLPGSQMYYARVIEYTGLELPALDMNVVDFDAVAQMELPADVYIPSIERAAAYDAAHTAATQNDSFFVSNKDAVRIKPL